ncbi:MAG TPA: family 16 glycosylhydrolase, partial [Saprospiraceae bacterium]|nr:family 16 glycosylhydrolase [Saprospiraceae bacterium]
MKIALSIIVNLFFIVTISGQCLQKETQLKFSNSAELASWHRFEGDGCSINHCGWDNNLLVNFKSNQVSVTDSGQMHILATQIADSNFPISSGICMSEPFLLPIEGRIAISAKLPSGKGLAACFILQDSSVTNLEEILTDGTFYWATTATTHRVFAKTDPFFTASANQYENSLADEFHLYTIDWDAEMIRFALDGALFSEIPRNGNEAFWPGNGNCRLTIGLLAGGYVYGNPNGTTKFPATLAVKEVSVFSGDHFPYITGQATTIKGSRNVPYEIKNVDVLRAGNWIIDDTKIGVSFMNHEKVEINWKDQPSTLQYEVNDGCQILNLQKYVQTIGGKTVLDIILDDDHITSTSIGKFSGKLSSKISNPKPNEINDSPLCSSYERSINDQYDVWYFRLPEIDAQKLVDGQLELQMDVLTEAPVGTQIILQLEDPSIATPENFPLGRHSRYVGIIEKVGEWHRIKFVFLDILDATVDPIKALDLVLLFDSGNYSGHTYHVDNFSIFGEYVNGSFVETLPIMEVYPIPATD